MDTLDSSSFNELIKRAEIKTIVDLYFVDEQLRSLLNSPTILRQLAARLGLEGTFESFAQLITVLDHDSTLRICEGQTLWQCFTSCLLQRKNYEVRKILDIHSFTEIIQSEIDTPTSTNVEELGYSEDKVAYLFRVLFELVFEVDCGMVLKQLIRAAHYKKSEVLSPWETSERYLSPIAFVAIKSQNPLYVEIAVDNYFGYRDDSCPYSEMVLNWEHLNDDTMAVLLDIILAKNRFNYPRQKYNTIAVLEDIEYDKSLMVVKEHFARYDEELRQQREAGEERLRLAEERWRREEERRSPQARLWYEREAANRFRSF
jgi:hypothetical protein